LPGALSSTSEGVPNSACTSPSFMPTSCTGEVCAAEAGAAGLLASRRLAGTLAGVDAAGGVVSAIGPDEAVCSDGAGVAEATCVGVGSAQPQSAIKAITHTVRFNVVTFMFTLDPLAEIRSIESGSMERFLVVVAVHWSRCRIS